jgi:hypothetical protein
LTKNALLCVFIPCKLRRTEGPQEPDNWNFLHKYAKNLQMQQVPKIMETQKENMMEDYRISEDLIAHYDCRRTREVFPINGDLEKPVWKGAENSRPFQAGGAEGQPQK